MCELSDGSISHKSPRKREIIYADAGDEGFRFIFPAQDARERNESEKGGLQRERDEFERGGLQRERGQGHFVTIVGRGGTGKSFLALQLVTHLLDHEQDLDRKKEKTAQGALTESPQENAKDPSTAPKGGRPHAAFYFTLEASPRELANQAQQFDWGQHRFHKEPPQADAKDWECEGLHVVSIPSPVADLSALMLLLRQTIANQLATIGRLVAIVIDPLGGVLLSTAIRNEISQLRELASSHSCFLFLLTEGHIFERHRSIEHYSQTIIHLHHDHEAQPYRSLHVQKSRGQPFRSGHHQLEFDKKHGLQIFPSMQAQAAYAHEMAALSGRDPLEEADAGNLLEKGGPFIDINGEKLLQGEIDRGSVLFLMGPPGTFKQLIATNFASLNTDDSSIYISFKADRGAVDRYARRQRIHKEVRRLDDLTAHTGLPSAETSPKVATYFLDARSPLLTPELILSWVRQAIGKTTFSRAVVWGLRRLNDMPNFSGGKVVQFLEALVTLLHSSKITSLLVDWPDKQRASTLPIVDLSHYILLTRVCGNPDEMREVVRGEDVSTVSADVDHLWGKDGDRHDRVTFLRVQRTRKGFYRNQGSVFWRHKATKREGGERAEEEEFMEPRKDFERLWKRYGIPWEEDPGLVN